MTIRCNVVDIRPDKGDFSDLQLTRETNLSKAWLWRSTCLNSAWILSAVGVVISTAFPTPINARRGLNTMTSKALPRSQILWNWNDEAQVWNVPSLISLKQPSGLLRVIRQHFSKPLPSCCYIGFYPWKSFLAYCYISVTPLSNRKTIWVTDAGRICDFEFSSSHLKKVKRNRWIWF